MAETGTRDWVNFHYYPLGSFPRLDRFLRTRLFRTTFAANALGARLGNPHGRHTLSETLRRFAAADTIITGRYHAACLAVAFGKPLECLSSNTPKIERLMADVLGISAAYLISVSYVSLWYRGKFYLSYAIEASTTIIVFLTILALGEPNFLLGFALVFLMAAAVFARVGLRRWLETARGPNTAASQLLS